MQATRDEFLTAHELATWMRVPIQTVYDWNHDGTGPRPTKIGARAVRYRRSDVERWLAELNDEQRPVA